MRNGNSNEMFPVKTSTLSGSDIFLLYETYEIKFILYSVS